MKTFAQITVLALGLCIAGLASAQETCISHPADYTFSHHGAQCVPLSGPSADTYMAHPMGWVWDDTSTGQVTCPVSFQAMSALQNECDSSGVSTSSYDYDPGYLDDATVTISVIDNNPQADFACYVIGLNKDAVYSGYYFDYEFAGVGTSSGTGVQDIVIDLTALTDSDHNDYLSIYCNVPPRKDPCITHVCDSWIPSSIGGYSIDVWR